MIAHKKPAALDPRDLFAGGGEIALMERTDWAATRLGAIETWSPALGTVVRFLLAHRLPLLLWWRPDFCQFHNNADRPILGTITFSFWDSPLESALARSLRVKRAQECVTASKKMTRRALTRRALMRRALMRRALNGSSQSGVEIPFSVVINL
jgi:hypothetical protein